MGKQETVRGIDEMGRVVLPQEMRKALEWEENSPLAIRMNAEAGEVILKRHTPACHFCGAADSLKIFQKKNICSACQKKIAAL